MKIKDTLMCKMTLFLTRVFVTSLAEMTRVEGLGGQR